MVDDRCMIEVGRGGRRQKKAAHFMDYDSSRFVSHRTIVLSATILQIDVVQENRAERNDSQCEATGFIELYK